MTTDMDCCAPERNETQGLPNLTTGMRIKGWVRSPQGLMMVGIAVVAIGLASNWSWLVAVGAAPLILSLAPCAAMCALGLCMNMRNHSGANAAKPKDDSAGKTDRSVPSIRPAPNN